MLVLSRKKKESIIIGNGDGNTVITITVLRIRKGCVQLGIQAPREVRILREEIR